MLFASSSSSAALSIGIVVFPNVTQLDVTGPYEVFARMPATTVHLMAATLAPIRSEHGLTIVPELTFDTAPPLDVVCVPGGIGVNAAMEDEALLEFLQLQAHDARYLTSVCTGALVLGAAGLLQGYRATTHWLSLDLLPLFGAHPVDDRIVIDRNRITGAGVTAGIDYGLFMASMLCGATAAQEIQLMIEYTPSPPFNAGSPRLAPADLVQHVARTRQRVQSDRRVIAERAAARLDHSANGTNGKSAHGLQRTPHALPPLMCDRVVRWPVAEPEVDCLQVLASDRLSRVRSWGLDTLEAVALRASAAEGVAIDSLEPGTTLCVRTRNSEYRFVILFDQHHVLVQGGTMFPAPTTVRFEGSAAGGSALKMGWILVGFHMEMWLGFVRVRSSCVRSISVENVPAGPGVDDPPRA
jgi:cyclohexyl-isocyanide hydratase